MLRLRCQKRGGYKWAAFTSPGLEGLRVSAKDCEGVGRCSNPDAFIPFDL